MAQRAVEESWMSEAEAGPGGSFSDTVASIAESGPLAWSARLGLVARGLVYFLMGFFGLAFWLGYRTQIDQKSVLREVIDLPLGAAVVALCAVGFLGYAVWRFSEAASGVVVDGDGGVARAKSFGRGVVYLLLAITALTVLLGSRTSQGSTQRGIVGWALDLPAGQVIVAVTGLVVVGIGLVLAVEGGNGKFLRYLDDSEISPRTRWLVRTLGTVGSVARGCVLVVIGLLLVLTGVAHDEEFATGMEGAFQLLQQLPGNGFLVVVASLGLIAFGIYGLLEARYRRVGTHGHES
jgi:hypothetical protein